MRSRGVLRIAAFVLLLVWPARAWADNEYAVVSVGYRGVAAMVSPPAGAERGWNHAARLGFVVYGGDWFLKLRGTLAPGSDEPARFVTEAYGGVEVGTHWPLSLGNLAVGLVVDGKRLGLKGPDGRWLVGGRGFDGGASLHFAFPVWGRVRLDPAVAAGASVLWGGAERVSGVFAYGELEALIKLSSVVSLSLGVGFDVRTYGDRMSSSLFDMSAGRFDLGIAFHDFLGIGHNDF